MPVFQLSDKLIFPATEFASDEGLLAIGGDLCPERLLLAYRLGIFPWPCATQPLLWFCPDPRFALLPQQATINRSLLKKLKRHPYEIKADTAFSSVIRSCALIPRKGQEGTWITPAIIEGYSQLYEMGLAHSVEAFADNQLVGGLYGVSLGGVFYGESMFSFMPDASKIAFSYLLAHLVKWDFDLVDCQSYTQTLAQFGATFWPKKHFLQALKASLNKKDKQGKWQLTLTPSQVLHHLSLVAPP